MAEMEDGIVDSDEETDFSKMDMGNKKGPVGRYIAKQIDIYGYTDFSKMDMGNKKGPVGRYIAKQ